VPHGPLHSHLHLNPRLALIGRVLGDGGLERCGSVDGCGPRRVGVVGGGDSSEGVDRGPLQGDEIFESVWHWGILRGGVWDAGAMRLWREYWQAFGVRYGLFQAFMAVVWVASGLGMFGGLAWLMLN